MATNRPEKPAQDSEYEAVYRACDECVDRLSDELERVLLPLAIKRGVIDRGTTVAQLAEQFLARTHDPRHRSNGAPDPEQAPTFMGPPRPPSQIDNPKEAALVHLGWLADQIRNYRHIVTRHPQHWSREGRQSYVEGLRLQSERAAFLLQAVDLEFQKRQSDGEHPGPLSDLTVEKVELFRGKLSKQTGWKTKLASEYDVSDRALRYHLIKIGYVDPKPPREKRKQQLLPDT
jgi:hypothetical protein